MKKKLVIVVLSSVILVAISLTIGIPAFKKMRTNQIRDELFSTHYSLNEDSFVVFENGSYDTEKNSLAYIKETLENIPECLEVDVVFSKDLVPYVSNNFEAIDESTVPLEYLFQLISSKTDYSTVKIALNLVQANNLKEIDNLAEKYNILERVFFTGITKNQADYINSQQSQIFFVLDYELDKNKINDLEYIASAFSEISETGAKGVNLRFDNVSKELSTMLKENWMMLSIYGMKTDYDFYKSLSLSPNIIFTDKPIETRIMINRWRANAPVEYYGIITTQADDNNNNK